eukprot:g31362.t1
MPFSCHQYPNFEQTVTVRSHVFLSQKRNGEGHKRKKCASYVWGICHSLTVFTTRQQTAMLPVIVLGSHSCSITPRDSVETQLDVDLSDKDLSSGDEASEEEDDDEAPPSARSKRDATVQPAGVCQPSKLPEKSGATCHQPSLPPGKSPEKGYHQDHELRGGQQNKSQEQPPLSSPPLSSPCSPRLDPLDLCCMSLDAELRSPPSRSSSSFFKLLKLRNTSKQPTVVNEAREGLWRQGLKEAREGMWKQGVKEAREGVRQQGLKEAGEGSWQQGLSGPLAIQTTSTLSANHSQRSPPLESKVGPNDKDSGLPQRSRGLSPTIIPSLWLKKGQKTMSSSVPRLLKPSQKSKSRHTQQSKSCPSSEATSLAFSPSSLWPRKQKKMLTSSSSFSSFQLAKKLPTSRSSSTSSSWSSSNLHTAAQTSKTKSKSKSKSRLISPASASKSRLISPASASNLFRRNRQPKSRSPHPEQTHSPPLSTPTWSLPVRRPQRVMMSPYAMLLSRNRQKTNNNNNNNNNISKTPFAATSPSPSPSPSSHHNELTSPPSAILSPPPAILSSPPPSVLTFPFSPRLLSPVPLLSLPPSPLPLHFTSGRPGPNLQQLADIRLPRGVSCDLSALLAPASQGHIHSLPHSLPTSPTSSLELTAARSCISSPLTPFPSPRLVSPLSSLTLLAHLTPPAPGEEKGNAGVPACLTELRGPCQSPMHRRQSAQPPHIQPAQPTQYAPPHVQSAHQPHVQSAQQQLRQAQSHAQPAAVSLPPAVTSAEKAKQQLPAAEKQVLQSEPALDDRCGDAPNVPLAEEQRSPCQSPRNLTINMEK